MEPLLVICPQAEENPRLSAVLSHALEGRPHVKVQRPDELHPVTGQRVLFAVSLLHGGVNLGWYAMLSAIRQDSRFFDGCCGAVLVDGDGELYTKSAAREIVFAANQAGCAFMGAPLVEATGSLENFHIRAMLRHTDYLGAYTACTRELVDRLLADTPPVRQHPHLMVLHASNRKTSNTIALWERMAPRLEGRVDAQVVSLRNGTVADCNGCEFRTCLHFGEEGRCFYGGVIVDQVYPAIGSRRLRSVVRTGTWLCYAGAVVGLLLTYYLTSVGSYGTLSPLYMLAFLALWLLPTLLLSGLAKRF